MATPKDVHEATGCVTGAVPPFGSVFSIPTFVDNSLQEQGSTINFNAVRDFPVASPRHWDAVHSRRLGCAKRPRDVVVVCDTNFRRSAAHCLLAANAGCTLTLASIFATGLANEVGVHDRG